MVSDSNFTYVEFPKLGEVDVGIKETEGTEIPPHQTLDLQESMENKLLGKNSTVDLTKEEVSHLPFEWQRKRGRIIHYKKEKGVKHNNGKPQLSLLFTQFPKALEAVAKCSEYGHEKYKETDSDFLNFKRVDGGSKAYADAGLRHRTFPKGTTDIDSQLPHAFHICWNALAELQLWIEENE